ncbi:MAG: helix-turn-helix domain-containing protein [Planctomycetota bacterium]|nr:helix-turn-helix domain-containing protein [Planctomycetota bacterium]
MLNVISLARLACVHTWAWAAGSLDTRTRLAAQLQQAQAEIALLREELRIKDARMAAIPANRRPHYPPTERMAILELRAARGWNQVQTAKAMLVTPETVAAWNRRIDEQGPHALVCPNSRTLKAALGVCLITLIGKGRSGGDNVAALAATGT